MRKSAAGRIMRHCKDCAGIYRCIHCNKAKESKEFKTYSHPHQRCLVFDDGERMRIAVCYACDYKLNKERYSRYDKKINKTDTLRAFLMQNMSRWRAATAALGLKCDLTQNYLQTLWDSQRGLCFYTGQPIKTVRGKGQWESASLDRKNPKLGYTAGNVVWTTRLTNFSKNLRTVDEFVSFCRSVVIRAESIH